MKRILFALFLTSICFFQTQKARAELLIEPLVGWSFAEGLDIEDSGDFKSGDGPSIGGRIGYQKLGFQLGLDYLHSSIDMSSNQFDEDVKSNQWAGFVGFKFPILFRVYAGYIFSADGDSELNGRTLELKDGTGGKFGLGFTILPFLDINLEYRKGAYDKFELGSVSSSKDVDFEALMLGVSLPFTI